LALSSVLGLAKKEVKKVEKSLELLEEEAADTIKWEPPKGE
jgi:hypothetical protein